MHKYMCYSLVVCAKYVHIVQYAISIMYWSFLLCLFEEGSKLLYGCEYPFICLKGIGRWYLPMETTGLLILSSATRFMSKF